MEKCRKACVHEMSKFEKEEYKIKARERDKESAENKERHKNSNTTETASPIASSTLLSNINPYNTKQFYGKAVA